MFFGQTIRMCFKNIMSNKLRSFLTMLGIIIGISSVIILVGLTQGASDDINSSLKDLGANVLTVSVYSDSDESLSYNDIDEGDYSFFEKVLPVSESRTSVKANSSTGTYTFIGTTTDYIDVQKLTLSEGRNLADLDIENASNVAIIGSDIASDLFENESPIGEKVLLNSKYYTIVGVLNSGGSSNSDNDSRIIVPITSYAKTKGDNSISTIYFVANEDIENIDIMERMIDSQLGKVISTDNFEVITQDTVSSTLTEIDTTTTILIGLIGIISLVVSGIGVVNIMLVSVSERTREIGIRKAIGATDFDILKQFLIEAILLTTFGGVLGVLSGYLFEIVANTFELSFAINTEVVLISLIFSVLIGIIFGIIPAIRASKLKPIDALKSE